ncbi:methyl-accepting chemotaxis protein [Paenibacillus phyllosphaerae]|uniref:Methyl-accepting chemotaxis protein n=1 Tax=Paenibacillus phyllosphaerae TaxID=274593 RepID=A0A7W5FMN9_9BACL|nr:methyl-accepting chemotaxis protein [Paenibacillus phyllosphaerae]MBB3110204.1 methyl-accepting chemotaxis protein [Paenibacillus phyllosphaerae]
MKLLKNLSIAKKLMMTTTVSAIALGSVGVLGFTYTRSMANNSEVMYGENLIPLNKVMQIRVNARASDAYTLELLLTTDNARNEELQEEITSAWEEIDGMIEEIESTHLREEQVALLETYKQHAQALQDARNQVIELAMHNKNAEAYNVYTELVETNRKLVNDALKQLQSMKVEDAGTINSQNQDSVYRISIILIIVSIVSLLLLALLSLLIARMIVKPVNEVKQLLSEAEQGDFTVKGSYKSKDEIGALTASFNNMTNKLQSIFGTVQASSHFVASTAEELSASAEQNNQASEHIAMTIQELATGTETQVDKVADSSAAINDMAGYTKTIADNTERMKNDVLHASQMSAAGNEAISEVNVQMNSIHANVNSLFEAVSSLNERSNQIEQITNVISGITAQTNLLALNAAIEAARAGEHGKGFAVVAGEVRKLAEQSNKSTEQISQLIHLIQQDTQMTLQTMEKASQEVNSGIHVVNNAGSSFQKIDQAVSRVVAQIEDIAKALNQLAAGTSNVNASISDVREVAQESASITQNISAATEEQLASMQEISSSSQALAGLADELQKIMTQFKI